MSALKGYYSVHCWTKWHHLRCRYNFQCSRQAQRQVLMPSFTIKQCKTTLHFSPDTSVRLEDLLYLTRTHTHTHTYTHAHALISGWVKHVRLWGMLSRQSTRKWCDETVCDGVCFSFCVNVKVILSYSPNVSQARRSFWWVFLWLRHHFHILHM